MARVGLPFLATRLALFAWAWYSCLGFEGGRWRLLADWPWLDAWVRWDAGWYLQIVQSGYYLAPGKMSTAAFFPLYPFVTWLASAPLQLWLPEARAVLVTGIVLSYLAFWFGLAGLRQLMLARADEAAARRAIWLTCLFPFSYFFGSFYTEGLYFALTVWAFVLLERNRDASACGLAALAITCRAQGLFMGTGLVLELARRRRHLAPGLLVGFAALSVAIFYAQEVGKPLAMMEAQRAWRGGGGSLEMLRQLPSLHGAELGIRSANLACLVLVLCALGPVFRRYGPGYALATLLSMLVPAWTSLESLGRFTTVLFPVFMLAAELTSWRALYLLTLALFGVGLTWLSHQFFTWGPAF